MGYLEGLFKNYRVYILTSVAYLGSFLFRYDTSVMGSVLALDGFKLDFGLSTGSTGFASSKDAQVSSNVVPFLNDGAFFRAIFAAILNDRLGRRYSLMIFAFVFLIFCIAAGIFVLFFLKEIKGRSLEDMDLLFGAVSEEQRRHRGKGSA